MLKSGPARAILLITSLSITACASPDPRPSPEPKPVMQSGDQLKVSSKSGRLRCAQPDNPLIRTVNFRYGRDQVVSIVFGDKARAAKRLSTTVLVSLDKNRSVEVDLAEKSEIATLPTVRVKNIPFVVNVLVRRVTMRSMTYSLGYALSTEIASSQTLAIQATVRARQVSTIQCSTVPKT